MIRFFLWCTCFWWVSNTAAQTPSSTELDSLFGVAYRSGDYRTALGIAIPRLERALREQDFDAAALYAYNAALSSYYRNELEASQNYTYRGLDAAARSGSDEVTGRLYLIQSILKMSTGELDSVRHYARLGAAAETRQGDPLRAANVLVRVASSYEMEGRYDAATPIFRQYADTLTHYNAEATLLGYAMLNLAGNYSNRFFDRPERPQLIDTARIFYDSAYVLLDRAGRQFELTDMLRLKSQLDAQAGDSLAAIEALQDYAAQRDSIRAQNATDDLARLQAEFDTERREATIRTQQNTIAEQRTRNWLFGGLTLLALLAGGGFYLLSRRLRERNRQNEFLVKEIHHRTKNNLQVLSSLLALQTDYIDDPAALDAVNEGRNRVQSIGLLHQQLYTGAALSAVDPRVYFPELGEHLLDTFEADERVTIDYRITAPPLNVDTAIPLGLIANELLTNALKYAYPAGVPGRIDFRLGLEEGALVLRVRDYGAGQAAVADGQSTSFGRDLIDILKDKLKATVHEHSDGGWHTEVRCRRFTLAEQGAV